ncbi:hypothetical protein INT08_10165 [Prosthecochloris sp. N3]|uniref:DUF883 domain-containing protein n=1 Tax=Prosthecochloris ethylica TaxID=2743976 RepID=A0ABR9XUH8_9CHLB|nr:MULTISPECIES: DUF883 C-terminal domain-containing protein [Prosthecochloris]MBF0586571.1 hypothetical protein [Prosthecochloris ethylica]MBF0637532.1 hypothetical protein [Prosthecochloris ethylica]NUK47681.1 hypothetical protein [Prosthecochloris ethylica]RNA64348.1 hypothetical protein CR163_003260 [Prosthecochloris sp. ZM_2]
MQEIKGPNTRENEQSPGSASRPQIPEQVAGISEHVSDMYNQFRESQQYSKLQDRKQQLKEYIKDHPLESVAYAVGAGFLFGLVFHKKR